MDNEMYRRMNCKRCHLPIKPAWRARVPVGRPPGGYETLIRAI
jgi:hypothetical protein